MAVSGGFPINLQPQVAMRPAWAGVRVAGAVTAAGNDAPAPLLDSKGLEVGSPESRYGLSMQTLQLLKQYDVRNMSGKDLDALSEVMLAQGDMAGDVAGAISSDIESKGWNTAGDSNALEIFAKRRDDAMASVKAGEITMRLADFPLKTNARVREALEKLAGIHDALQGDGSVQAAASDSMSQALELKRFNDWTRIEQQGAEPGQPPATYDQKTADAVMNTLQRLGVKLPPADDKVGAGDPMAQAWSAYQAWRAQHPDGKLQIDLQAAADKAADPSKPEPTEAPAAAAQPATPISMKRQAQALVQGAQLQAQYGMSLPMLQLLKGFDVANASVDQVKQLGQLLQGNGALSQDDADSLLPLTQRGMVDTIGYYRRDLSWLADAQQHGVVPQYRTAQGMADLANVAGRARNDQQAQAVLDRLAGLHQALQGDDRVQAVADGGLQQASDLAAFNVWAQVERQGARSGDSAQPEFRSRQDVDGIFRTLQRIGVELTPLDGDANVSQKLAQAWKDYQGWSRSHPDAQPALQLAPAARINDFA
ncbi:hypothetical protein BI347_14230 [Chromobacterium sphagni]|uniref:Uncharacterized protein n=2 Tax=Chromobacterium sphagni TaxID=1903179 RepID=A0A1S1X4Z0_9NEIS|nr:hypothetical protein BI347_14230 [Chromobacterium sphagni]